MLQYKLTFEPKLSGYNRDSKVSIGYRIYFFTLFERVSLSIYLIVELIHLVNFYKALQLSKLLLAKEP